MELAHSRHTDDFLAPPTIAQIERQIRWEGAAVEAGVRRYREGLLDLNITLADTSPGQRIIREIMTKFVPHLAEVQEAAKAAVLAPGKQGDWMWLIQLLPPEILAYQTLRAVLSARPQAAEVMRKLTGTALALSTEIEREVAFRSFVETERANKREARKLGQPYKDLYEGLLRSSKVLNKRTFTRWMSKLDRLWRQGWAREDRLKLGSALISHLVEYGLGYVELRTINRGGKWTTYLALTAEAEMLIEDGHARAELMAPPRRPMLCKPKPWIWES